MIFLALSGCLLSTDAYLDRRAELTATDGDPPEDSDTDAGPVTTTDPRVPDPPGVLVSVRDPFGAPGVGVRVEVDGVAALTDPAGLVWASVAGPVVVSASASGVAPTGAAAVASEGVTGVTLDLVALRDHVLVGGVGTLNVAGRRSIAFPPGTFDTGADVTIPYAWAQGHAPPAVDVDGAPIDVFSAVYLGEPAGASWIGPATWRMTARSDHPLRAAASPSLYRFDEARGAWAVAGAATFRQTHLEAAVPGPGWYAFAVPWVGAACPMVVVSDESARPLPRTELRVVRVDRDAPNRYETDADGLACLQGALGFVGITALRGGVAEGRAVWMEPGLALSVVPGVHEQLVLPRRIDADQDGLVAYMHWDCDDADPAIGAGAPDPLDGVDQDCDGVDGVDRDRDGVPLGEDCDPLDPTVAPGLDEVCDGLDNDCDLGVDDGVSTQPATSVAAGVCVPCAPQTIANLRPVLYVPFDDLDAAHAADHSGWGRDLNVTGDLSVRWPGVADWDAGTPRWFGSIERFLWLEDTEGFWPTDDFTVSVWLRPEYTNRRPLSYEVNRPKHDYAAQGCDPALLQFDDWSIHVQAQRTLLYASDVRAEVSAKTAPAASLPVREWTHLVLIREGGVASMYVDGLQTASDVPFRCEIPGGAKVDVVPYATTPGGVLRVGQDMLAWPPDPASPLDGEMKGLQAYEGLLDELAVFDRALTPAEVAVLFHATLCDETCNAVDDDQDGLVDEHILGTGACPAEGPTACTDIWAAEATLDSGPYAIRVDGDVQNAWCDLGTLETHVCGDGTRSPLTTVEALESCDPGDPSSWPAGATGCDDCVADVTAYRDCQEVLNADPTAPDGLYRVDLDGPGPYAPVVVRCDMDGAEGWTLVFRHDTRAGVLFRNPNDPDGSCPSLEVCDNGVDDEGATVGGAYYPDTDLLADCDDPECFTSPTCNVAGSYPENLLCTDGTNCTCACEYKTPLENTWCIGPSNAKFSIVGLLDAFQDVSEQVAYRLRWPFHEETRGAEPLQWCQDWLPTEVPTDRTEGVGWFFHPIPTAPATGAGFAGLAPHGPDPDCEGLEEVEFGAFDGIDELDPTDTTCSHLFLVGVTRTPNQYAGYGYPSNTAHGGDYSSKTVELWARRGDGCVAP